MHFDMGVQASPGRLSQGPRCSGSSVKKMPVGQWTQTWRPDAPWGPASAHLCYLVWEQKNSQHI